MGAVAHGAQTVQCGHAQGRSEIAVAAAAHSGAFHMLSQLFRRLLGQGESLLVGRGEFQGRAADAAGDLQGDARPGGLQALDDAVDPLGLRQGPGAHIHFHLGPLCHDVGPGAALGHAHIDCGALVVVGQRMEEQGLLGHLFHCTDAALGVIACVGGFAMDGDGVFARAFPGFFQVACHRLCRFGAQHHAALAGHLLDERLGCAAAHLFVGIAQQAHFFGQREPQVLAGFHGPQRGHQAAFHIQNAGAIELVALLMQRQAAGFPHGVKVGQD